MAEVDHGSVSYSRRSSEHLRRAAVVGAALMLSACNPGFINYQSGMRLGQVRLYAPKPRRAAVVFLFSDASGWDDAVGNAAATLAHGGAVVIGVDLRAYLGRLAASDDGCHYLISEIEDLSKRIQRDLGFEGYRAPILAGVGQGGTLAYAALAQAPAATLAGAIGIDPAVALHTRVALCAGAPATADAAGGFRYGAADHLPGWWRESHSPNEGTTAARLLSRAQDILAAAPDRGDAAQALPLIEYPVKGASVALVFFSGDGGWRDLDKQIGELVARRGVAVIGVDSLRYFWRSKTPERIAADLDAIMRTYGTRWDVHRFALAGYSFGADVLPFAYNRLASDARARVVQVSLLGVESSALFEFKLEGWLHNVAGQPVAPELYRMPLAIVQCFYGEDEDDTLCPAPEMAAAEVIRTKGSHHFDGDYAALAQCILDGLERRGAGSARDHTP